MINKELYCITWNRCDTVGNEKASIRSRGLFGGAWRRPDDGLGMPIIVTLHVKERNSFVECYV